MKTAIHKKTVFLSYLRIWKTKGVPPMSIGVVIHALRIPTTDAGIIHRETECAWIIKGGICDG